MLVSNYLYVYNLVDLRRIQRIPLQGRFAIVPNDDFAASPFLFYSSRNVYQLGLLAPEDQIQFLTQQSPPLYDQALSVAINHALDSDVIHQLHFDAALFFFAQNRFDEAIQHFQDSCCSVEDVLFLYKDLQFSPPPVSSRAMEVPLMSVAARRQAYEALVRYLRHVREAMPASNETLARVDTALVFALIALQAAEELKAFLLSANYCDVALIEERLVQSIKTAMTEKSRLVFTFTLLYLFEGKQQFKRVRVSLCLEL